MENIYLDVHYWFVPCRIIWDNWKKFMGERSAPGDHNDYLVPQVEHTFGINADTIFDYMGIPPVSGTQLKHNALPFRAYNLIWNEFYRDPEIIQELAVPKGDGPDDAASYNVMPRFKRHDYFTTCRPSPQRGPEVGLPLGGTVPIEGITGQQPSMRPLGTSPSSGSLLKYDDNPTQQGGFIVTSDNEPDGTPLEWAITGLQGNLGETTAANINQLRTSITIQQMYERDMRAGGRYSEQLMGHFGVSLPDAQWRPEYLGGSSTRVNINPVAQTAPATPEVQTPQGNLSAYGEAYSSGGFRKSFVEHGYVLGLASVRADLNYQQGIEKMWLRETRFDFFYPTFQHLGEQAVMSAEIYADGSVNDATVFGYQERYAEYRYKPSKITGQFRSGHPQTLDTWHLAQQFGSRPNLNYAFMQESPPMERILAVEGVPEFLVDSFYDYKCARPMATYSTPGLRRL